MCNILYKKYCVSAFYSQKVLYFPALLRTHYWEKQIVSMCVFDQDMRQFYNTIVIFFHSSLIFNHK